MKSRNGNRHQITRLAVELHEDDGVDPRDLHSRINPRGDAHERKTLQLCKEAARSLQIALTCDCNDPLLNELEIVSVEPGRNASQLAVTVRPSESDSATDATEVLARLNAASGFLRAQVAAAVSRRRAPELRFTVLPSIGGAA